MTDPATSERWSFGRMAGLGTALLAGHLGLVWLLDAKPAPPAAPRPEGIVFRWINSPLEAPSLAAALLLEDPAFGVVPSVHGFSASGWLNLPPVRTIETEWSEPPRWLEPDLDSFGHALRLTVQTNQSTALAASYQPAVDQLLFRPRIASEPVRPQSEWELSPALRTRLQGPIPQPPAWTSSELLRDTAIDLWVDAEGVVQSVRLWESSGLVEADEWALSLAWKLAFTEAAGSPRESGRLVVRWKTLPAAAPAAPTP